MNMMTSEWYEIEGKVFWKLVIRLRQGLDLLPLLIWDWTLLYVTRKLVDAVSELSFRKLLPFKVDVILCSGVPQTLILESRQRFRNRPWWVSRNLQYHHVPHSQRRREVGKARGKNKKKREQGKAKSLFVLFNYSEAYSSSINSEMVWIMFRAVFFFWSRITNLSFYRYMI